MANPNPMTDTVDNQMDSSVLSVLSDDDDEDVEPKLKYQRLGNDVAKILQKDAASYITVHPKFFILGTHWGNISILDHLGNIALNKKIETHTVSVNQLGMDERGEYFASCSDDEIKIQGFYSSDLNYRCNSDRPIKSIAIDPNFYKPGSGRRFITGGEKLIMYEKAFFSRLKTRVLYDGNGMIRNIKWNGQFVSWASDDGVRIFDLESERVVALIKRDHSGHLRSELYRCNLFWKDNYTLLIGWADTVKVCVIRTARPEESRNLPTPYVEIVSSFTTQFYVSGIAPYENCLVILCCNKEEESEQLYFGDYYKIKKTSDYRPQFCIIEPNVHDYSIICIDMLTIRGYEEYRCNDYHLEFLQEDNSYYIISPKDIIVTKPRDEDDHVAWLIEHKKFERAMTAVKENEKILKRHSILEVGHSYLDHLLTVKKYEDAATLCVEILGDNKELWEEDVFKFAQINQLQVIAKHLPYKSVQLEPTIYEMVLNEFLQNDYEGFQKIIKQWPCKLYNIAIVIAAVLDKLAYDPNSRILLKSLGDLYMFSEKYDKAFSLYMKLELPESFDLIPAHKLFKLAADNLETLMRLDKDKTMKLCLSNIEEIPIDLVVKRLSKQKSLLCYYLDRLFAKDNQLGGQWHGVLVSLYAEVEPTKLLSFLKSSNYYPLQEALEVCRQYSRFQEQVFLLGRIGNSKQALHLITDKLNDINAAIEFCKEYDDKELWDDLIRYSLDKPEFIKVLLNNIGTHIDPIVFIKRIDNKLEIPGLRDALVNILHDYNLQMSLREGCKRILVSDWFSLQERLIRQQKRGIAVYDDYICHACHEKIVTKDNRQATDILIFYCKHVYHELCLRDVTTDTCMTCISIQKRGSSSNTILHSS